MNETDIHQYFIEPAYLAAAILFILGIRDLSSAETARRGNFLASIGMFLAIIVRIEPRRAQAKIGAQVDNFFPRLDQRPGKSRRCSVGKGQENQIEVLIGGQFIRFGLAEAEVTELSAQGRVGLYHRLAYQGTRCYRC